MDRKMDKILAEISVGELVDKITILEIKKSKIKNKDKVIEVDKELKSLIGTLNNYIPDQSNISKFKNELKNTNLKLWDIENNKRAAEKIKKFDDKFIELARNVYKLNDERSKIKLAINNALGSNIKEVKSYE